jgi:phospholipid/cholesterol/gamma-HCH transport system substrate-binding protein
MAKVDSAFAGFDKAVTKIEGVVPGFADGKADELFEKIKGLHELADTMKKKSASYIEDIRRSLLDVSEAANKMAGTPPPAAVAGPPRRPTQQKR